MATNLQEPTTEIGEKLEHRFQCFALVLMEIEIMLIIG